MSPARLLFALDHPGRLINLGSTVSELAARGHEVHVSFSRDKLGYALDAIDLSHPNITLHHDAPQRVDDYVLILHRVRRLADYVHYLDASLSDATWAREGYRSVTQFPFGLRWLKRRDRLPRPLLAAILGVLGGFERVTPTAPPIDEFVRSVAPDVMVVSPLILARSDLGDYLATARHLSIPSVFPVASWDNLTSKGLITQVPDTVTVWNATQKREAVIHHRVPDDRIVVTGSIQHDQWFDRGVQSTPQEFNERHGLPPGRPFVLFAGSTRQGRDPEAEVSYVRDWVTALRSSDDPLLREIPILLRPHPLNASAWLEGDVPELPGVFIWHRKDLFPFGTTEATDYFDGLFHCAALVGINTSAMIETAIAGRPVHTIALPEWRPMQEDLLHFRYLLPGHGGFLRKAGSFDEHVALLGADLRDASAAIALDRGFVESFIRPLGLDRRATLVLIEQLEDSARADAPPRRVWSPAALVYRGLLGAVVLAYSAREKRDLLISPVLERASVWSARRSARRPRLRRLAVSLRQREDRALERLLWLGASDSGKRLSAEKWVYRRVAAERHRRTGVQPASRQRPEKWVAAVGRERARAAKLPRETEPEG
jgi:hypothetical protein